MPRPRTFVAALGLAGAALTLTPTSTSALLGESQGTGLRYVALGDSYSAASGVLPSTITFDPRCTQSEINYPKLIARRIDARLKDVTCGGAETKDFFTGQFDGVAPQLDALGRRTQLVTMTIGGNDEGVFMGAIVKCGTAGLAAAGQGSPCKDEYGAQFRRTIREKTQPNLVRALRAVKRRAPNARVAILGYPWIMPKEQGCFDKMPIAKGDVPYLRNIQWTLNDAVRRAAKKTNVRYINFNRISDGHDACQRPGVRWIEPITQSTNPVVVHPNALGERKMAQRVIRRLGL